METERDPLLLQELRTYNYRMRALREEKGYSLKKLSELSGVSSSLIGKFERLQGIPEFRKLERIADALDTSVGYILSEEIEELIEFKFPYKVRRIIGRNRILEYNQRKLLTRGEEYSPEKRLFLEDRTEVINNVLSTLHTREARIIKMYFGIGYENPLSLEEIGKEMGLTGERIRQIKEKAVRKLRLHSRSDKLREYL